MKLPLSWLADFVTIPLAPREFAEKMTMSGSLVEQVHNSGSQWQEILVAQVERLEHHPNADSLWLATLSLGHRQQTVVTGAQNLFVGAIVPFIPVGARLPGQTKPLEARMLRGIMSEGMVCSAKELGLSEDHQGILILNQMLEERSQVTEVTGRPLSDVLGETVLELDITPNRPDCLSIYGLAREASAVTGVALGPIPQGLREGSRRAAELASVHIEASDLCGRCTARVLEGVQVGPSPEWLVQRLQAVGIRSINNVVDCTNYVMIELGQPLHAYDLDALAGHSIVVRRAIAGERIKTLDDVERTLSPEMLVIADEQGPVGIAGVMGSAASEVRATTSRILLEAATFNGKSIRRTATALGLRSEASTRFEKGLPGQLAAIASERAAALIAELTGATVATGLLDQAEVQPEPTGINFMLTEVQRLLGVEWSRERIQSSLESLGFQCLNLDDGVIRVTVPWWRADVEESADLVEEVARIIGFDAIPETLLEGAVPYRATSQHQRWYEPARLALLAAGLSEGSSPALVASSTLEMLRHPGETDGWLARAVPNPGAVEAGGARFQAVKIVNPLSPDREYLRPTLLGGLLEALRDNFRNGEERAAFFDIDFCVFAREKGLPLERRTLAIAMAGSRQFRDWSLKPLEVDFFDLKGVIERLLLALGIPHLELKLTESPLLHPGRSANLEVAGQPLGFLGELHPEIAATWDLGDRRAYIAEVDFEALAMLSTETRTFADFSRLPLAKRDLAIVVDESVAATDVSRVIRESGKELIASLTLFDLYRGGQVPEGRKSLAYALDLQAHDHTLTEEEIEKTMSRIQRALHHRLGATVRE